jgi:hypothetical protein
MPGHEFAFDASAVKVLAKAKERGWTVVSMQKRLQGGEKPSDTQFRREARPGRCIRRLRLNRLTARLAKP